MLCKTLITSLAVRWCCKSCLARGTQGLGRREPPAPGAREGEAPVDPTCLHGVRDFSQRADTSLTQQLSDYFSAVGDLHWATAATGERCF